MQGAWFFICITSAVCKEITIQIDGTINLGDSEASMRSKHNEKSKKEPMIDIVIKKDNGISLAYSQEDVVTRVLKHKRTSDAVLEAKHKNQKGMKKKELKNSDSSKVRKKYKLPIPSIKAKHSQTTGFLVPTKSDAMPDDKFAPDVYNDLFVPKHKVKLVEKIKNFTNKIYEESMKTFDDIAADTTDYAIRQEIDHMRQEYIEKFGDFVRKTQEQNVKTKTGHEKVFKNTVDTSNRILGRLLNYLMTKIDKKGLRHLDTNSMLLKALEEKRLSDNKRLCVELKICRAETSFIDFAIDLLNIIISANDEQVKEVTNAVIEVLKTTDFAMDVQLEKRFHRGVDLIEMYDSTILRALYTMLKNLLISRNEPIEVNEHSSSLTIKTVAFLEIVEMWDKVIPANEKSLLEWGNIRNGFEEWKSGKRSDVQELVQAFVDQVAKAISNMNKDEKDSFAKRMNIILGY